jgi:4-hydroxy-tetrahydrodipicolinate synthase
MESSDAMKYSKSEAKQYSRANFKGVWAATLTPFHDDLSIDEAGFRSNLQHWIHELKLSGFFVGGKQAEYFSLSLAERKRLMDIAVEEARGTQAGVITSCSDTNLDVVMDLAQHSQRIGADYIVVHSPVLHFGADTDETIYEYYRYLADNLEIGIALWNHPDCGYVMSPELCARIAELPNIVAIKYSVDRALYVKLTEIAGDKILVSTSSEQDWLDNIIELKWQLYLCSTPPYLLQTARDRRMNEYTELAFAGQHEQARRVHASLQPVREAIQRSKPRGKPQAHGKAWQRLLGQAAGPVRRPLLNLTSAEVAATEAAFVQCGLVV